MNNGNEFHASVIPDVLKVAGEVLHRVLLLVEDGKSKGGYLTILGSDGQMLTETKIGRVANSVKAFKYASLSMEKAFRLHEYVDHVSSFQNRNTEAYQYGGAVRTEYGHIFAFSGLPELWDEVFVVVLAIKLAEHKIGSVSNLWVKHVAQASRNPFMHKIDWPPPLTSMIRAA